MAFRKPSLTQVSAVAGTLASLAAVFTVAQTFTGDDGATDPQQALVGSVVPVSGRAVSPENRLLSYVPPAIRGTCTTTTDPPELAVASVDCTLAQTSGVSYHLFSDSGSMFASYRPTAVAVKPGNCPAEWNVESSYYAQDRLNVGQLKCYTTEGEAWIEWTRDELLVHAWMSRDDDQRKALFDAWNLAGPLAPAAPG